MNADEKGLKMWTFEFLNGWGKATRSINVYATRDEALAGMARIRQMHGGKPQRLRLVKLDA